MPLKSHFMILAISAPKIEKKQKNDMQKNFPISKKN